jgi:hypothetical protein
MMRVAKSKMVREISRNDESVFKIGLVDWKYKGEAENIKV